MSNKFSFKAAVGLPMIGMGDGIILLLEKFELKQYMGKLLERISIAKS